MRGRVTLGSTAFTVLAGYAERIGHQGGRLYVSGVDPGLAARFHHVVDIDIQHSIQVYEAHPTLGESTRQALHDAEAWLVRADPDVADAAGRTARPAPVTRAWRWIRGRFHRP
jgi:SulP family sulfate permease